MEDNKEKLAYQVIGEGRPLICLSGFGCDHYNFLDLVPFLKNKYQMILIDNRGMGKSFRPDKNYKLRELSQDVLDLVEILGIKKFSIMGISMGGFIAQMVAEMEPEKVETLFLLCTTGPGKEFTPIPILSKEHLINFYNADQKKMIPMAVDLTTHPKTERKIKDHIINTRLEHPAELDQILFQRDAIEKFFNEERINYKKITSKTFILSGDEDRFVSKENSKILNEKITGSSLKIIPESDHFFFMEKPKEVARLVLEHKWSLI